MKEFNLRKRKRIVESPLAKESENQNNEAKRLRISSPSSINRNMIVNKSDSQTVEKQTKPKIPVNKTENFRSNSHRSYSGSGFLSLPIKERKDLERFRNFWSSSKHNDVFEDDEIEIKEELNTEVIEDLVVEDMDKRKKQTKLYNLLVK